ncbi:MAG: hypothetical protein Q9170_002578 [Blastenia crenularia]
MDFDFNLVNSTPDGTILPEDRSHLNPSAAIASVVAAINADPLPQSKRSLETRDVVVATYDGYTANTLLGNASIHTPLDCNKHDTHMGAKLFTDMAFDTALRAAACSAQIAYNLRHPPANGPMQTCQFYNTYAMNKNCAYQGQYGYISSNATNPGQCPQAPTKTPLDLTANSVYFDGEPANLQSRTEKNLVDVAFADGYQDYGLSTRIYFPIIADDIYGIS